MKSVLVASGTANTGNNVVRTLSASGKVHVRALCRKPDADNAKALAALPNVTVVKGDFEDAASLKAALAGVDRALLVSPAGDAGQYDREVAFLAAAKEAGIEGTVRISTCNVLIDPNSKGVYAQAHGKIEEWIKANNAKAHGKTEEWINANDATVCDVCPNWFMTNVLWAMAEVKGYGSYTLPCSIPTKRKFAMIDPRDIGSAAAAILLSDKFAEFIAAGKVNVSGPAETNYSEQVDAINKAAGTSIQLKSCTADEYAAMLAGAGMTEHMSTSFTATVQMCAGEIPPARPYDEATSPLLLSIWKPEFDVAAWAAASAPMFK
ncbi:hypothetical protein FOA52_010784 [Chlamydomonas sp. UWO 241]|nr:hypothetical protein FOA52_010784 [Chlamydomonas sp. UWO 241]